MKRYAKVIRSGLSAASGSLGLNLALLSFAFAWFSIPGLGPLNFPTFAFPPPPPSAPKYGIGGPQAHTEFKEMAQAKSP